MSIDKTYLKKYLTLTPEIYIEKSSNHDEFTVFCYTTYLKGFINLYSLLKDEIEKNYENNDEVVFKRYVKRQEKILGKSINNINIVIEDKIKLWFNKYDITYFNFDSILHLDKETALYSYLNLTENDQEFIHNEEIYDMQIDFLNFTKIESINMIKIYMNSFYELDSFIDRKFIDFFNPEWQNNSFLNQLKEIFYINSSLRGKGWAIMTHLLVNKNIIKIDVIRSYYKAWYKFIDIHYKNNESFNGIGKYINTVNLKIIDFKQFTIKDEDYIRLKEKLESLLKNYKTN